MIYLPYAQRLDNMILGDWIVVDRAITSTDQTGSHFSVGYVVESGSTGQRAFLKALNFDQIILEAGPDHATAALQEALSWYNFEVQVCQKCKGLDRVVTFLEEGQVQIDPLQPLSLVPYLIFEQAEGDVRLFLQVSADLDVAWALRCMHHIAIGLQQMHSRGLAHQDVKPSNVLLFGRTSSKIGDVGRAADQTTSGPYDNLACPGAKFYAPPEQLYEHIGTDWGNRHFGGDLYLLGSMLVFFFAQTTMTALLFHHLPRDVHPRAEDGTGWEGDYLSVLPMLQRAFGRALDDFSAALPSGLSDLTAILRELCDPNPSRRGDRRARTMRHRSSYDLQRYISRFDALSRILEARVGLRSRNLSAMTP